MIKVEHQGTATTYGTDSLGSLGDDMEPYWWGGGAKDADQVVFKFRRRCHLGVGVSWN